MQSSNDFTPGLLLRDKAQSVSSRGRSIIEDGNNSAAADQMRKAPALLSTVELFGNFRPPEFQPEFKVEPTEPDVSKLPFRSSRRPKDDRPRIYAIKPKKRRTTSTPRESASRGKKSLNQSRENTGSNLSVNQPNGVVDLTADDNEEEEEEEGTQFLREDNDLATQQQSRVSHIGPFAPVNRAAQEKIPDIALQYIRGLYRQDRINLPANIITWRQLEEFASASMKPSLVTPALISQYRTISWPQSLPLSGMRPLPQPETGPYPRPDVGSFSQQSSGFIRRNSPNAHDRDILQQNISLTRAPQDLSVIGDAESLNSNTATALETITTSGSEKSGRMESNTKRQLPRSLDNLITPVFNAHPAGRTPSQQASNQTIDRTSGNPQALGSRAVIATNITTLMRPSEALPQLLPSSAPLGHPHLVPLWHPYLLKLPKEQHDHLELIDTVVSIMSKYDTKEQSVIKAFFDLKDVQHFFFLFKNRTGAWHSWSIEREYNTVTIGLERNNRAANTTESQRPSSGQFDVTIQYKMDPPIDIAVPSTDHDATSAAEADNVSNATAQIPPPTSNPPSTALLPPETTQNVSSPSSPTKSATSIPGSWHLHGTTILPSQPPLLTFLWSTPPNRGADEVSRYYHPAQSHILPASHLSILARYLQHTAFTCTAIEAEFQVVWGRKVRYDSVLGRVRATYDHALKGAKTQAEKRKRGDYNRPVDKSGLKAVKNAGDDSSAPDAEDQEGGSKPGAGETRQFLSGRDISVSVDALEPANGAETEAHRANAAVAGMVAAQARSTSRTTGMSLRDRARGALLNDTNANTPAGAGNDLNGSSNSAVLAAAPSYPNTIKAERPRKRLKRERQNEASGSEYSDSGSEEE